LGDDDGDETVVDTLASLVVDASRLINKFKIGLGTGHLAVLDDPAAFLASSACFSAAAASRKLKFKASSDGQHFAKRIRRTARFEALLSACVRDMVWGVTI
jgi:hypothetical protein